MSEEAFKKFIGYKLKEGKWILPSERMKQYQTAVGDTRTEYMSKNPISSPAFTCVLVLEARKQHVKDIPGLNIDYTKVLHASQAYEFFKPLKAGSEIVTKNYISDIYIKREKLWIETTIDCYDGDDLCVKVINKIVVRKGGF
ncbi:MAG: MaoC family dehydratase N-terminal domain-containing protein [Candidatus Helarchaeota archaeon]|nr:MaoC family dehydratase N-terminal domain-containing protein [Candidatus Helarchaeota archaeon]